MCIIFRMRRKQNKYPILFLTQGVSEIYPQLMDIRCQTTQIAMSVAQSENILVSAAWPTPKFAVGVAMCF